MCTRCSNIKAQATLREMYKNVLGRKPTIEEMREFTKHLPKARPMRVTPKVQKLLQIELDHLRHTSMMLRFKALPEEDQKKIMDSIRTGLIK